MTEQDERLAQYAELIRLSKIPTEVRESLRATMAAYGLKPDDVKVEFISALSNTFVQSQGDPAMYEMAARGVRARHITMEFAPKTTQLEIAVFSTRSTPRQQTKGASAGQWTARGFGLVRSCDPNVVYQGPSDFTVYGLSSENAARAFLDSMKPGRVYRVQGKLGSRTPEAVLAKDCTGLINLNAPDADPIPLPRDGPGGSFDEALAALWSHFTPVTLKQLDGFPKDHYLIVRVEADVYTVTPYVRKATSQQGAVMRLIDDSISLDRALLERVKGSIGVFLPDNEVGRTFEFPQFCRVRVLVQIGKPKDQQDQQDRPTGMYRDNYSALALQVLSKLGSAAPVAGGEKQARSPPPIPGLTGANTPSALDL